MVQIQLSFSYLFSLFLNLYYFFNYRTVWDYLFVEKLDIYLQLLVSPWCVIVYIFIQVKLWARTSNTLLCWVQAHSVHCTTGPWIQETKCWGREETLVGELVDQQDSRLEPQNNHLIGVWMPGSFIDQREKSNEKLKSKGRIEREMQWGSKVKGSFSSVQLLSRVRLFVTIDCSMPGLPVHHQLQEFAQTHVHWVDDAIQPSHPLSSPSLPAFNLAQHEGLF